MPYTRISHTANGREAIEYALGGSEGKGHNDNNVRNLYITTVGMMYDPSERSYADQMAEYWKLASVKNTNQVRRIITSFSKDELDPEDPKSAIIAGEIARQHAIKYYPDRQVLICVQADGVGGCLHTHAIVNNVSMTDHKGCTDEQTKFHFVAKTIDAVAKEYTILSMDYKDKWDEVTGKAILPKDKVTQNVRRMKDANREASKDGESFYIWEEDLKHRIKQAMAEATSREDFEKRLTAHGVEIGRKGVSKKFGEYYTYELVDTTGFSEPPKKEPKVRSYNLGADYMPEAVDKMLVSEKHSRPEVKPEERPKVPEKTEADLKREEEAKKFVAWCHENGYELSTNDKYDLDKADIAQKAYDEYQKKLKEPKKVEEPVVTAIKSKSVVEEPIPKRSKPVKPAPASKKNDLEEQRKRDAEKQKRLQAERIAKLQRDAELLIADLENNADNEDDTQKE